MIPLMHMSLPEFRQVAKPLDIFVVRRGTSWSGKIIAWGQRYFLRRLGYTEDQIETYRIYVHTFQLLQVETLQIVEAVENGVDISQFEGYCGRELLWLRLDPSITLQETADGLAEAMKWLGSPYDYYQYMVYPILLMAGKVPWLWRKIWDDPNKLVCSGLTMKICFAMRRLLKYPDIITIPPARLALLDGVSTISRVIVDGPVTTEIPRWAR